MVIIPPKTNTGEGNYSKHLIDGLKTKDINLNVLENYFFKRPNIRIFLGSILQKNIIKDKDISIIHNLDNLGPFLTRYNQNVKNILTVHDVAPVVLPDIGSKIMKFNFSSILPILIKNSDLIIVPSYSTKNDLEIYYNVSEEKIEVIPMGIDTDVFYPREDPSNVLDKYGIRMPYLMYTGNDNPRKNLKNMIIAYSKLLDDIPHNLVLIGPINQDNLIKSIMKYDNFKVSKKELLNRIIMPGFVDYEDLPFIYSGADALIFPSLYEGFGLPPLEAMACGTPVIVSNNSSINEIVNNVGIYIDNPLDVEEIADKIFKLVSNPKLRDKLQNNGIKRAGKFSWENTVNSTLKAYQNII